MSDGKQFVGTMSYYRDKLADDKNVSEEILKELDKLIEQGNKIAAVQLLKKHNIIT